MSSQTIKSLFAVPRYPFDCLPYQSNSVSLCFIIDPALQPDVMAKLYGLGEPLQIEWLFTDTDFASLSEKGPIWIITKVGSRVAGMCAQLCMENYAGIGLSTSDTKMALEHARWLLKADDGSGGQSLISYYKPFLWAALALTSHSPGALYGPWAFIYTPAPVPSSASKNGWHAWENPDIPRALSITHYALSKSLFSAQREMRWVYWISEEHIAFKEPEPSLIPSMVENLETLSSNGIYQGRYLLTLVDLIKGPLLIKQSQAMAILESKEEAFIKAEQLAVLSH